MSSPFSLFADGGVASYSSGYALTGIRFSFGSSGVSLQEQDRAYDPPNAADDFINQESGSVGHNIVPPA